MDLADSIFLAAALHAAVLVGSWQTVPALGDVAEDSVAQDVQYVFQQYLVPSAEPEPDDPPATPAVDGDAGQRPHSESRCEERRGGSMGEPTAADAAHRYGVHGPADNPDPHVAREVGRDGSWSFGIGFTPQSWGGDPAAPTITWGRDDALGTDPMSARGNMWGDEIGLSFGSPGAGVGLKTICPFCGDDGRGVAIPETSDTTLGGATGTERAR